MNTVVSSDYIDSYLDEAVRGERRPAIRRTLDLLDRGVSQEQVVVDLLAAAQHEVGERWYRNELTAADEHVATGVSAAALDALVHEAGSAGSAGHTVVACAEGDWHALAAQMFGESLRSHGIGVTVLGASTPADVVAEFLTRRGADSLAVSCSVPIYFPGVARLVDAAHHAGFPVIVGGRALGSNSHRAARLGADAWAASAADAAVILDRWRTDPPSLSREPTALDPVALRLSAQAVELGRVALQALAERFPPMAEYNAQQLARTREDLVYIVQFLAAAMLLDEDSIFLDLLVWLQILLVNRGVPAHALLTGVEVLRPGIEAIDARALRVLDAGHQQLLADLGR